MRESGEERSILKCQRERGRGGEKRKDLKGTARIGDGQ